MMLKRGVEVPWSLEESDRLQRLRASGISWTQCAVLLGRSKGSCKGRGRRLRQWAAAGVESAPAEQRAGWSVDHLFDLAASRPWK